MTWDALLLLPLFAALIISAVWLRQNENRNDNDKEDKTNNNSTKN